MTKPRPTAYLEHWRIYEGYQGRGKHYATGQIYGDTEKRFDDGQVITTSQIVSGPDENNHIKTLNSVYCLIGPGIDER